MDDLRIERILRAVECVPHGRAATYGMIGRITGEVPRVVGWVMHAWGADQCWWRMVNARGTIPGHAERALPHWAQEGMLSSEDAQAHQRGVLSVRDSGIELSRVLVDEEQLRTLWTARIRDLPSVGE